MFNLFSSKNRFIFPSVFIDEQLYLSYFTKYICRTLASAFGAQVICNRIVGLTAGQRRICAAAPDAMAAVGHGIRMAKQECQQQFSTHRWNCTGPSKGNPFGHLQITGELKIYIIRVKRGDWKQYF